MPGLGTLVNTAAIILGGLLGSFALPRVPDRMRNSIMHALGAGVILIGIKMAWDTRHMLLLLVALALGTAVGEWLRFDDRLHEVARHLERWGGKGRGGFAEAFVHTTLLFCVGAMAITGSLQDGLAGDYRLLFAKSVLDGTSALIFAGTMGPGVILAAVPVLLYQGAITLAAGLLSRLLSQEMILEIGAVGGVLVLCLGLNMVGAAQIRVANLLPAMFLVAALVVYNPLAALGL